MRKALWRVLALTAVLIGGGVGWLYFSLDNLVASGIRSYGAEITQASVQLQSVQLNPIQGVATLKQLELGNPKGFFTQRALYVGQISMKLDVASINKDTVYIKEISIEQPEITYEYASGGSNLDVIQRNIEAYVATKIGPAKTTKNSKGSQKKMIIENLYIRDASVKVSSGILKGKAVGLPVPDLHIKDIGKKSGGTSAAEATRQVFGAMTKSVSHSVVSVGNRIKGLFQ